MLIAQDDRITLNMRATRRRKDFVLPTPIPDLEPPVEYNDRGGQSSVMSL